MLGDALKLSVNSDSEGQNTTGFFFPGGTWCNVFNVSTFKQSCIGGVNGQYVDLSTEPYQFDVHIREGYIVPLQNASRDNIMTTNDVLNNRVDLHIHPSCDAKHICTANGSLIVDDGEVLNYEGN